MDEGALVEAQELMADADHAFFSTCGSSLSVKSAMLAVADERFRQGVRGVARAFRWLDLRGWPAGPRLSADFSHRSSS
jgi:hypothetical protein